jgi:hypothetical protein
LLHGELFARTSEEEYFSGKYSCGFASVCCKAYRHGPASGLSVAPPGDPMSRFFMEEMTKLC